MKEQNRTLISEWWESLYYNLSVEELNRRISQYEDQYRTTCCPKEDRPEVAQHIELMRDLIRRKTSLIKDTVINNT